MSHLITIKPISKTLGQSNTSQINLTVEELLWQGIHVMVVGKSQNGKRWLSDLPLGQAIYTPIQLSDDGEELICDSNTLSWFGQPLQKAIQNPNPQEIDFKIAVRHRYSKIVILNCIDYIFGHALLKLLNADNALKHLEDGWGIVVIAQKPLEPFIPQYVSEIWLVDLPFSQAQKFYPSLDKSIQNECERFEQISIHPAYSHTQDYTIENFSGISPHVPSVSQTPQITFIWRNARGWYYRGWGSEISRQRRAIITLFEEIRKAVPKAIFSISGFGDGGKFPSWIADKRIIQSNAENEITLCREYAKSDLVIGMHGSSLLLPSAHALMTLCLMPDERWGNITQDILYQSTHTINYTPITNFRYRFIPSETKLSTIAHIASNMITKYNEFLYNLNPHNE